MTWPSNQDGDCERVFLVEFTDGPDAVLRILGALAVQGGRLEHLALERRRARMSLRIHVRGLDDRQSDHLRLRLGELPMVRGVSLGWRTAPETITV
jgi:hypothetical protein